MLRLGVQRQKRRAEAPAPHSNQKRKRPRSFLNVAFILCRQRPTLPHTFACSTIGPAGLNFRVRDGNGWIPRGKITDKSEPSAISRQLSANAVLTYVADARQACKRPQPPSLPKSWELTAES